MKKITQPITSLTGNSGSPGETIDVGNTTKNNAQRVARWLEEQGHSIEPHEESDEEE